jgi:drug/metabolite transporter (DMT)-like permease
MTIVFALIAAALFGAGVALQQRPAAEVPLDLAARPGLLLRLVRRRLWVVGVLAEVAAFAFQVLALRHGSLVIVQPLLTTSLLFTIAMAGTWTRQRVTVSEWTAVVAVVAGLAIFLGVAAPSEQSSGLADPQDWIITGACMAAALAALLLYGLRHFDRRRAASLALAAGLGDAFMAVLTKAFAHVTDGGWAAALTSWVPYALCLAGLAALLLTQTAYQSGMPKVSLPLITVTEPLISCAIGVGLFGEALRLDGIRGPVVVGAVVVMAAGLVFLSRFSVAEPVASRRATPQ